MSFAHCSWPIWRTDDFTLCFQQDYLKILLPLIIVALSIAQLSLRNLSTVIANRRAKAYTQIPSDEPSNHTDFLPDEGLDTEDEEDLEINGGRLALAKSTTRGSIIQADTPTGQLVLQVVEELAIVGLVAINAIALITGTYVSSRGRLAATAGLINWIYVLILSTLRLALSKTKWRIPHLWYHTAIIYCANWLFMIFVFRSVIIHPTSRLTQTLILVEFALESLLFFMAFSTRRGNKTVILEWEDGIEPSREPLASLFSVATFAWADHLMWKGWREPLEMQHVWNLLPKDKAATVLADYRQLKRTGSLAMHLLGYFKKDLALQCILAVIGGVFTFAPTLLLKAILEYVEKPEGAPINVLWLYVIGLPLLDLVRSWGDGMGLWIGRKICIRVRAITVGEIYAKALRRKAAAGRDKVLLDNKSAQSKEDARETTAGKIKRALGLKKKDNKLGSVAESTNDTPDDVDDEQANLGTIINLMSVDSFKMAEITAYLHFLVAAAPTQLIISVFLLWQVMGYSAIPGIVVMVFLLPINYLIGMGFNVTSKKIMAATDKRISITNEVLQNIRIIKYFAWEQRFGVIIDEKRHAELRALRSRFMVWATAVAIWNFVPVLITFFSFLVYTWIEGKPLYPSVAFTAISLFMLLRVPLDQLGDMFAHVQEAKVSIDRVDEFLREEETEKYQQLGLDNVDEDGVRRIGFRDATLIWGGRDTVSGDGSRAFRLLDLNVDFRIGKLNVITGPTGCGKTSMLMGLLGEMTNVSGRVFCPGGQSREEVRPDPETGLANTIAYVAQAAWLVNGNIKDNILFAAPYDEQRYRDVIIACALERDLEILDHGDETQVGEKGISLSGGQKQRISLARALYSNSAHVLLDDCLSAVDAHTAQWIFSNCIKGPLMAGRTCILVTHNLQLCVPSSDYVLVLDNGRITVQGPSQEVIASGKLGEEIKKTKPISKAPSRVPSRVPSSVGDDETMVNNNSDTIEGPTATKKDKKKKSPQQDAMDEGKVTGAVKWSVMKLYLTSMGPWWFWVVALIVFNTQQFSAVAIQAWVREWSNQYVEKSVDVKSYSAMAHALSNKMTSQLGFMQHVAAANAQANFVTTTSIPDVNIAYYLTVLGSIGLLSAGTALIRDLWLFFGSLTASRRLHGLLIRSVARARFTFFDVTPLGQIMNRFSKDLEAIDQDIAATAISVMSCALSLIVTVVLISVITPGFLIAAVFIAILFYCVSAFYLRASRDLKRLESVSRSPIFQQFGETLGGMTTIRAYGDERRFIRDNLDKINTQSRPFIYLWACNRWLAFRADAVGDLVSFSAGVFIILSLGKVDAGAAGMSLTYAMNFTENLLWLVRNYAINEQNMNSMERVKEYLDVEQEADEIVEDNRPEPGWPAKGGVEFVDYSTRYRADLEPVLRKISLKINPKEKVGIVGRTGAGKSSLTLALFRALEADTGKIEIDGVDVSKIGLRDLRDNITIVPQDPTLFRGTIRTNLDPFDMYTDEEVFESLRRVQLIGPDEPSTTPPTPRIPASVNSTANSLATNKNVFLDLQSPVSESGSNLSQGQRQLLCLARAMLKSPTVLVMDEATASIDYVTDSKIQETIRELTGTVITIAHRLQTIVDYDKVLVLDQGEVVEFDHPWKLISNEEGSFRSMCEMSGELDVLIKAAKRKWDEGVLVDDS